MAGVKPLFLLSVGLFAASLLTHAYYAPSHSEHPLGWQLLVDGWFGLIFFGISAWLANPFLLFGWLACHLGRYDVSAVLSLVALGFMLSFMRIDTIPVDEAVNYAKITGYGPGYWLWLASAVVLFAASIVGLLAILQKRRVKPRVIKF
jgi:hypothetical protein